METKTPEFELTAEQQEDLRGLISELREYYVDAHNALFFGSETLVGPTVAAIHIPTGAAPQEESAQEVWSKRRGAIVTVLGKFYQELTLGCPLIQGIEQEPEAIVARYKLIPNNVLQTEKDLRKTIQKLRARNA